MDAPILDPEEMLAIRQTIDESNGPSRVAPSPDATPIPLITDDRAADIARPVALKVAQRWARLIAPRLGRLCGIKPKVADVSCEALDAETLRSSFTHPAQRMLTVEGTELPFVMAIGGALVESIAARLLGAADTVASDRTPSATTLRIFTPAGDAIAAALNEAWHHEHGGAIVKAADSDSEAWLRNLDHTDVMLSVRIRIEEPSGVIAFAARPEMFLSTAPPPRIVPAPKEAIASVLGAVPVEVCVEVGRARLTMRELTALHIGEVIPLYQQVDGQMPVRLAGVTKAHGKAVISRGAFAVEVISGVKTEKGQ